VHEFRQQIEDMRAGRVRIGHHELLKQKSDIVDLHLNRQIKKYRNLIKTSGQKTKLAAAAAVITSHQLEESESEEEINYSDEKEDENEEINNSSQILSSLSSNESQHQSSQQSTSTTTQSKSGSSRFTPAKTRSKSAAAARSIQGTPHGSHYIQFQGRYEQNRKEVRRSLYQSSEDEIPSILYNY